MQWLHHWDWMRPISRPTILINYFGVCEFFFKGLCIGTYFGNCSRFLNTWSTAFYAGQQGCLVSLTKILINGLCSNEINKLCMLFQKHSMLMPLLVNFILGSKQLQLCPWIMTSCTANKSWPPVLNCLLLTSKCKKWNNVFQIYQLNYKTM